MIIRRYRTGRFALSALLCVTLLCVALLDACTGAGSRSSSLSSSPSAGASTTAAPSPARTDAAFTRLEARFHAKLGVYVLDTGTGRTVAFQADTRFPYCSTFKALATGLLLMRGAPLNRVITYRATDLVEYSPITSQHVSTGMALQTVMEAALEYSDNTAANLLLGQLGGPDQLQQGLRRIGDVTTNANRNEPSLNDASPGDTRDTSTARALGTDLRQFVLGHLLSPSGRQLLAGWLLHNTTGGPYIRAGLPTGWKVGDKTGNGDWGTRDDIAIAWPSHGAPYVIAVLSSRGSANASSNDALIADATRAALAGLR